MGSEVDRVDIYDPQPGGDVSYFAKISRADQECAWTSPIWVNRPRD